MSEHKRTFIAVRFSSQVEELTTSVQGELKRRLRDRPAVKWVEPRNLHLTLQFLGDVDTGLFPKLAGGLRGAFGGLAPFPVVLSSVGAFPSLVRPRVIWLGFTTGADRLKTLQSLVVQVTEPLGFAPESRPFSPHLTLGRIKEAGRPVDISKPVAEIRPAPAGCQIDRVHLVTSELKPAGPVYTDVDSFPLGG